MVRTEDGCGGGGGGSVGDGSGLKLFLLRPVSPRQSVIFQ